MSRWCGRDRIWPRVPPLAGNPRSTESGTHLVIHNGSRTKSPKRHTPRSLRAGARGTGGHPIGSRGSHLSSSAHQLDPRTSGVACGGGACAPGSGETDERGPSACVPPMGFQTWLLESPAIDVSRVPAGCYIVKVERVRDTDAPVHRVGWGEVFRT